MQTDLHQPSSGTALAATNAGPNFGRSHTARERILYSPAKRDAKGAEKYSGRDCSAWRHRVPPRITAKTLARVARKTLLRLAVARAYFISSSTSNYNNFIAVTSSMSTVGTVNALTLAGARTYYAMAQDGLFFASAGRLNSARVPAVALFLQGLWSIVLVLPRTYNSATHSYGNLYSDLPRVHHLRGAAFLHTHNRGRHSIAHHETAGRAALPRLWVSRAPHFVHCRRRSDCGGAICVPFGHYLAGAGDCCAGHSRLFASRQNWKEASWRPGVIR